jgi:hypothetical protein
MSDLNPRSRQYDKAVPLPSQYSNAAPPLNPKKKTTGLWILLTISIVALMISQDNTTDSAVWSGIATIGGATFAVGFVYCYLRVFVKLLLVMAVIAVLLMVVGYVSEEYQSQQYCVDNHLNADQCYLAKVFRDALNGDD